jgi:hypothetical protein
MNMTAPTDIGDVVETVATSQAAVATAVILAVGALSFGIKGLWVGWRAGSKAMGKTGT